MKRTLFGKLSEFFDGKGFYITLILCAAAIGISGYVLFFGARSAALDDELNIPDAAQMALGPDASDAIERPITTEIPDYAFVRAYGLTTLHLPDTIEVISEKAFRSCNIATIYFAGTAEQWEAIGGSELFPDAEVIFE